ncbi:hypothetical protein SGRIM128S_02148 [Streptomyces griseomycini]
MRFSDEPIPDFPRAVAAETPRRPALDKDTRHALLETFPGRATLVDQIARLLEQQPPEDAELEEFGGWCGCWWTVRRPGRRRCSRRTRWRRACRRTSRRCSPAPRRACEEFARALARLESPARGREFALPYGTVRTSCCGRRRTTR